MVVALATFERRAQPDRARDIHAIDDLIGAILFLIGPRFHVYRRAAMKSRSDLLARRSIGDLIARDLLDRKLVERQVRIERANHPVAIRPNGAMAVALIAIAVRITGRIEPRRGPPLAITGRSQQPIDHSLIRVGRRVR